MEHVKVFAATFEDEAAKQVNQLASLDAYKDSIIRIMPDAHAGKGCTIGTTMTIKDKITPNLVGVDIGCGMLVVPLNNNVDDLADFDRTVRKYMPCGFAVHDEPLKYYPAIDRMASLLGELRCKDHINMDYMLRSLGTLGGGNHFIELDVDENGRQYLVIHSGSRNLGVKVAEYYQRIAIRECQQAPKEDVQQVIARLKAEGRANEIQDTVKRMKAERSGAVPNELAYVSGQSFDDYIHDMEICQDFASVNRGVIASHLLYRDGSDFNRFETVHNYIDTKKMMLRKGAVSAEEGERLIIPMNMRDGSLICVGLGNEDWNYSELSTYNIQPVLAMNKTDKWNFYCKIFRPMLERSMTKRGIKKLYYEVWIDLDETFESWFDFMYKYPNLAIGTISRWLVRRDKWYWGDDYVKQLNKAMETESAADALSTVLYNSLKH